MTFLRRLVPSLVCFALLLDSSAAAATDRPIELRRRHIEPARTVARAAVAPSPPRRLQLVQFDSPPSDDELDTLRATGARIVDAVPHAAYLVWTDSDDQIAAITAALSRRVRYRSDFAAVDALSPALDDRTSDKTPVDVTVQLVANTSSTSDDLDRIIVLAERILVPAYEAVGGKYVNVRVRLPGVALGDVSALPTVVNVEPYVRPTLLGERQGQILAAALDGPGSGISGPGYLAFLANGGFSTNPNDYPVVAVVDDGVDNGTTSPIAADLYRLGVTANGSRMTFAVVPPGSSTGTPAGPDGHGTINASIVGGYNDRSGSAFADSFGFHYGLGISPYGRLANVRIFAPDFDIGFGNPTMVSDYYARGARISANSWGADTYGAYDSMSQEYDALTRDARSGSAGNQQMLFVFAAGNEGPGFGSVGSPGTAKNVITVGASETSNPDASVGSGCGDDASDGDDARDMSSFSSRGPCDDGRMKPDIVAPGTFIQGLAAQPTFNGSGVCGPSGNNFAAPGTDALFPPGSAYTWSSGTSHSTPAIAGAASLTHEFLSRVYGIASPSPALTKAFLVHGTRHLTGSLANESLPGRNQGFGIADFPTLFDDGAARLLHDQERVFAAPGESLELVGEVADPSRPLRVVLAWTDAPGAPFASAYVNDLDLTVEVDGNLYRGNNFVGDVSQPGGVADTRNNVEAVFLPPGTEGIARVTIRAVTVAGDGVPGNGDSTDQDFALVVYNVSNVTSAGSIDMDRDVYTCTSSLTVTVADADLADSGTTTIDISSSSGDSENALLTEDPPGSGVFTGTVASSPGGPVADGVLQVGDGATIVATYADADDGSGQTALATDDATTDCIAPEVSGVGATALNGSAIEVSLDSDETTGALLRFGTSCAGLDNSRSSDSIATSHTITVEGLDPETTYFYILEVSDTAGNMTVVDDEGTCFSISTPSRTNYFVEQFDGAFDLSFTTLALVPDGSPSFYSTCQSPAQAFTVDPIGGTLLDLDDDDFVEITLAPGHEVSIYGTPTTSFFVGSNGFISYQGDSDYSESLPEHFAIPRVSALFDDLNPSTGGTVSVKELSDRVAITFENVPEYFDVGSNTFQIVLFYDGRITLTYLSVSAVDGIAGVSPGGGLPADFLANDLSTGDVCSTSAGSILLDHEFYTCSDSITVEVRDLDLAGTTTVAIEVASDRGDSETLVATESPINSGKFAAMLSTDRNPPVVADGTLQVGAGDTITALYSDADNGEGLPRTVTATARTLCGDAFLFYQTTLSRGAPRFRGFAPVELTDAFRAADFKVLKIDRLGTPVATDGSVANDPSTHMREYRVREDSGEARFPGASDLRVRNGCGTLYLDVNRPVNTLLPAAFDANDPVAAPAEADHELDSYLCYSAKALRRLANGDKVDDLIDGIQVDVVDDLNAGETRRYDIKKVTRLCLPAAIDGAPALTAGPDRGAPWPINPATIRSSGQSLLCYSVGLARKYIAQDGCGPAEPGDRGTGIDPRQTRHERKEGVHTADGFGSAIAKTSKEKEICLPTIVEGTLF